MTRKEEVLKLAALARLRVPEERLDTLVSEFDQVLAYVGQIEALTAPKGTPFLPYTNVFRDDVVTIAPETYTKDIVAGFPKKKGNQLSVKKIISHD
ncbi:MAG: aspartyl/glutamyl-tRNA amidotransferase subunit C [Candidatus Pacebacteria bacterium]|nr:aspartyl/glutamyl-tRNA amidotransferase subunit C [Candidatus Paceibacterota bacterium]